MGLAQAFIIAEACEAVAACHDADVQVVTFRDRMAGRSGADTAICKHEQSVSAHAALSVFVTAYSVLRRDVHCESIRSTHAIAWSLCNRRWRGLGVA